MAYDRLKVCICEVSMNVALISLAYGDYLLCTGVAGIVFSFIQRDLKYVEYLQDYLYWVEQCPLPLRNHVCLNLWIWRYLEREM